MIYRLYNIAYNIQQVICTLINKNQAFEIEIDGLDLGQLIDPNGFFRFLQHFSTERLILKVIERPFDGIIKADLELANTNEDLIKKGMV